MLAWSGWRFSLHKVAQGLLRYAPRETIAHFDIDVAACLIRLIDLQTAGTGLHREKLVWPGIEKYGAIEPITHHARNDEQRQLIERDRELLGLQ